MIKKTLFIIMIFLITTGLSPSPDQKLSLEEAINLGLVRNPEILKVKNTLKQAKIGTRQSISAFLPSVNLTGQRILKEKVMRVEMPSFIPGEPPTEIELDFTKNYEMTLQVIQPVFTGGKVYFNLKNNLEMKKIQTYLLMAKENEIKARIRSSWFTILLHRKSSEIAQDGLKLATDIKEKIKTMFDQGMVKRLDLLRAKNRVTEMNMRYKETRNRITESSNELKALLDHPLEKPLSISSHFQIQTYTLNSPMLFQKMSNSNPILSSLTNQTNLANFGIKLAYGNLLPNLSLMAQYSFRGDRLGNLFNWDDFYSISLNLSYPLFKGLSSHFNIARAKARKEEVRIQEKISRSKFETLLTNSLERDQTLLEKIVFVKNNLENTREEFDIATISYEEGLISYTDLEQIHNQYLSSQFSYYQAYFEYYLNIFQIETLIAEDIYQNQGENK